MVVVVVVNKLLSCGRGGFSAGVCAKTLKRAMTASASAFCWPSQLVDFALNPTGTALSYITDTYSLVSHTQESIAISIAAINVHGASPIISMLHMTTTQTVSLHEKREATIVSTHHHFHKWRC